MQPAIWLRSFGGYSQLPYGRKLVVRGYFYFCQLTAEISASYFAGQMRILDIPSETGKRNIPIPENGQIKAYGLQLMISEVYFVLF